MTKESNNVGSDEKLIVATAEEVNLNTEEKNNVIVISPDEEKSLEAKADEYTEKLINIDLDNQSVVTQSKEAVESMGEEVQKEAASQFQLLRMPLKTLMGKNQEEGDVAKQLIELKLQVEELDPAKFDFEAGWFSRILGFIPGVGTPLKRYFSRFESAQDAISAVINSLENGRSQLERDNITLVEDQNLMRTTTHKLEKAIKLGELIDQKINYKLEREITDERKKTFVKEEMLFPLRQRVIDLQQQLAVNQQGVISLEIIMRNNKELVRGVSRALNVTVNALQVAGTVAMALNNQKIVLDKIDAVNATTNSLIAGTANRLKTQGVEIQKQASSAQIDMEVLKVAFADINTALNDLATFKQEALPVMAQTILDMDKIIDETENKLKEIEKSREMNKEIVIEP